MLLPALTILLAMTVAAPGPAASQSRECGRDAFSKAVDEAAGALRKHSGETQPRILAGIRQLKDRHGWRDDEEGERARELLSDAETEALDQKAAQLLANMDRLSEEAGQAPGDCAKLSELRATGAALQTTVKAKTTLVLKRIAAALTQKPGELPSARPDAARAAHEAMPRISAAQPMEAERPAVKPIAPTAVTPSDVTRAPIPPVAVPSSPPPAAVDRPLGQWTVTTTPLTAADAPSLPPPLSDRVASLAPPASPTPPPSKNGPAGDTYSVEEIRSAARGIFGNLSTNLASVIEYAFSNYGRPNAYVIGEEGGGAFVAGVRYGKGKLFTKRQSMARIYWHGPSLGYDFGASGSRTLFLIYRLDEVRELYSGFSGIDGSAYFIGGAGITFLSNNKVIMAPIRTGLGFRLGANVGYLRFTPKPTWNPF